MTTPQTSPGRQAGAVQAIALLLPSILVVMAAQTLVPILPQMGREFAAQGGPFRPETITNLILTVPSLALVLSSPLAGWIGDRFGRRRFLLWAMVVYALIGMAPLMLESAVHILISRVLVGIAEAVVITLSTTLIGDFFKGPQRDRWLGYQTAVATFAAVILVAVSGILGQYGWRMVFAIYALPLVFAAIIWMVTWEPEASEAQDPSVAQGAKPSLPWKHVFTVSLITLFGSAMFYVLQLQMGTVLDAVGVKDPQTIGMFSAVAALGTILGTILFRFVTSWRPAVLLLVGFLLIGSGMMVVATQNDPQVVVAALFVGQLGCGLILPTLLTWAIRGLAFEVRGRGVGIWQGVFAVGQFASGMTFAALTAANQGNLHAVFQTLGIATLAAAALALVGFFIGGARIIRKDA